MNKPAQNTANNNNNMHPAPILAPHLVVAGAAEAIEFYKKAFGAEEMIRMPAENGKIIHASISINGAMVMMVDEVKEHNMLSPTSLGGTPVSLHLNVDDVDAAFKRAVDAGAKATLEPNDAFWGARFAMIEDPFGHVWSFGKQTKQMSADEMKAAAKTMNM